MGFLSELKKLVFGAESLSKSAARKGREMAEDAGEELWDKATDLGETLAEKTGGLRDAILHQAEGTIDMVSKNETLKKAATEAEQMSEKVLSKGEELLGKGAEKVEQLGKSILGENNENLEKAKDFAEGVGSKILETKDKLQDKAEDLVDNINDKIDSTLERAKAEEAAEAAKPKKDLKTILEENEGSMLDGKDDFFSKAEKFAKGDYQAAAEGKVSIQEIEAPAKEAAKAAGFSDLDGDGNEVIDDAIIEISGEEE